MAMGAMGCKGQGWTQGSQGGASSSPLRQWLTRLVAVEVLGSGQSLDILKVELTEFIDRLNEGKREIKDDLIFCSES